VLILIKLLADKLGLKATLRKRNKPNNVTVWIINISKLSLDRLKRLISLYKLPQMLYKLGPLT